MELFCFPLPWRHSSPGGDSLSVFFFRLLHLQYLQLLMSVEYDRTCETVSSRVMTTPELSS